MPSDIDLINEGIVNIRYNCNSSILRLNISHHTKFHLNPNLFDTNFATSHISINN